MAARKVAEIEQNALEARSRLMIDRWDGMLGDVLMRLWALQQAMDEIKDPEVNRHVVVSLIAAMQTYFRGTIISLCAADEIYRQRAAGLINEKFTLTDALGWIGGSSATFGELVAHMATCNSVADMFHWFDGLLDRSAAKELEGITSPHDQRNKISDAPAVVKNVKGMLATLDKAFQLRHILAHEAATTIRVKRRACVEIFDATYEFINGIDAVLWATAYKHLPLTQFEMNAHASEELMKAEASLETVLSEAAMHDHGDASAWLKMHQAEWQRLVENWYANTYGKMTGTSWPSIAGMDRAKCVIARRDQIAAWANATNPNSAGIDKASSKFSGWFGEDD